MGQLARGIMLIDCIYLCESIDEPDRYRSSRFHLLSFPRENSGIQQGKWGRLVQAVLGAHYPKPDPRVQMKVNRWKSMSKNLQPAGEWQNQANIYGILTHNKRFLPTLCFFKLNFISELWNTKKWLQMFLPWSQTQMMYQALRYEQKPFIYKKKTHTPPNNF